MADYRKTDALSAKNPMPTSGRQLKTVHGTASQSSVKRVSNVIEQHSINCKAQGPFGALKR